MKLSIICTSFNLCLVLGSAGLALCGQHMSVTPATAITAIKMCIVIVWQSIQVDIKHPTHKHVSFFVCVCLVASERKWHRLISLFSSSKFASLSNQLLLAIKWSHSRSRSLSQMTWIIEMKCNSVIRFLFIMVSLVHIFGILASVLVLVCVRGLLNLILYRVYE